MSEDDLEAGWDAVWESLPAFWQVSEPTFDPARVSWSVSAIDEQTTGRGRLPRTVRGEGISPAAALLDLDSRLRGVPPTADGTHLDELRRRLRLA